MSSSSGNPTDVFGALQSYQTIFLVISNLFLLIPALKAFWNSDFTRTCVFLSAMLVSSAFHLCKTKPHSGGICLLPFCTLRSMDYSTSITLLLSVIYAVFPWLYGENVRRGPEEEAISPSRMGAEGYVLVFFWISLNQLFSLLRCGSDETLVFMIVALSIGCIPAILSFALAPGNSSCRPCLGGGRYLPWDMRDFAIGFGLGVVAISLFVVESFLNSSWYWITHSLWHVFAALSAVFLLDCRSRKSWGLRTLVFCWNTRDN